MKPTATLGLSLNLFDFCLKTRWWWSLMFDYCPRLFSILPSILPLVDSMVNKNFPSTEVAQIEPHSRIGGNEVVAGFFLGVG